MSLAALIAGIVLGACGWLGLDGSAPADVALLHAGRDLTFWSGALSGLALAEFWKKR